LFFVNTQEAKEKAMPSMELNLRQELFIQFKKKFEKLQKVVDKTEKSW